MIFQIKIAEESLVCTDIPMRKNSVVFPLNTFSVCLFGFGLPQACIVFREISDANTPTLSELD